MDIRVLKVGDDEIIGIMVHGDDESITLERVLRFIPHQTSAGLELGSVPYFLSCPGGEVKINRAAIRAQLKSVPKTLEDNYLAQTTSIVLG